MQQVVLFGIDFSKKSAECLTNDLQKVEQIAESNSQSSVEELFTTHFKTPYDLLKIDISEPPSVIQDIIERYKGLSLGIPEEWFHVSDRIDVRIRQKNIKIEGNPSSFLLMPKDGTPVRVILNDNYTTSPVITLNCITNINYGNQESVIAFEQQCDEQLVRIQGNINLLNSEISKFNEHYRNEIMKRLREVTNSKSAEITS